MHDLVGAYCLDALDADEASAFEEHLEACAACRHELAELAEAVLFLAGGIEPEPLPEPLKPAVVAARPAPRHASRARGGPSRTRTVFAGLAVATAAVVGLTVWNVILQRTGDAEFEAAQAYQLDGASGAATLAIDAEGEVVLVVSGLPDVPEGSAYQLWYVQADGSVAPGPQFQTAEGAAVLRAHADVPVVGAAVSVEPAGTRPAAPSTQPVLVSG